MKKTGVSRYPRVPATSPCLPKRTALDADRELSHIQRVVSAVRSTSVPFPIGVAYWKTRLHELRSAYALLPVHRARLSALELNMEKIAQEQESAGRSDERRVA
jgi:hypothetical protein